MSASETKNYGVKDLTGLNNQQRQDILSQLVQHKLKFELESESPVTGVLQGLTDKLGTIKNGKEDEAILLDDLVRVTDYGDTSASVQKVTAKPKADKKPSAAPQPSTNGKSKRAQAAELLDGFTPADRKAGVQKLINELGLNSSTASGYFYQLVTKPQNGSSTRSGSQRAQAAEVLQGFTADDRKAGVQKLIDELGLKETTASGYFYQLVTKPQNGSTTRGGSKRAQAAEVLQGFSPDQRQAGVRKLIDELGLNESTASVYFYQLVTKQSDESSRKGPSKREQAAELLQGYTPEQRKDGVAMLQRELEVPKNTASTYFYLLVTRPANNN